MTPGNGYDAQGEDQRIERRVDEVESHLPRIGALEHDTILLTAAQHRLEALVGKVDTNVNNLRHELQLREDVRRKEDEVRWTALGNAMTKLLASAAAK